MYFKVGDTVRIVHYDLEFNGLVGTVVRRDGEYHYVDVPLFHVNQSVELEVYSCELELVEPVRISKTRQYFKKELFEI